MLRAGTILRVFCILGLCVAAGSAQPPAGDRPPGDRPPGDRPPPGGNGEGGFRVHVFPPGAREQLNLSGDQEQQIADLEREMQQKLNKILTADQQRKLRDMRPPGRNGQGGPGGPGFQGGQGGGQGGPGGRQRPPGKGDKSGRLPPGANDDKGKPSF